MRVLFFATYFPKPGNLLMGTWAMNQAQALLRAGVDVSVISLTSWLPKFIAGRRRHWSDCPQSHVWGRLPVYYPRWLLYQAGRLKRWDYRRPALQHEIAWASAAAEVRRIVRRSNPDLVFAHHTWNNGDVARRLKAEFGLPYVIMDHDYDEVGDCEHLPARRTYFSRVMRHADCMAAVSQRMEQDVNRLFPSVRTTTVHNGSDPIDPALMGTPRPPELTGKQVLLSASGFYPRKAMPVLVRAFAKVAGRHPNAVLRIVGDGEDRPAVDAAVRETGTAGRINILGMMPHRSVMQEMAWCDLFALVGWDEPWGVVYNEAMSAGKPIVCCNDGGINDVLRSGVHGLSVPPRDIDATAKAFDMLLSDDAARRRMGAAARDLFLNELTWDANAQTLIRVFDGVLARDRRVAIDP